MSDGGNGEPIPNPEEVSWKLVYTKQAQKDAKKLAASNLKEKAEELLVVLKTNPQNLRNWHMNPARELILWLTAQVSFN